MDISIIIPTLNERDNLNKLLLFLQNTSENQEIIVVDANSNDGTAKVAASLGAKVIKTSVKSRAHQMNEGARLATGKILYFVHADVLPPETFRKDIQFQIDQNKPAGCYRFRFKDCTTLLKINSYFTRFNLLWCRGGDQTFFIKRELFQELGGFDERFVIMEDFELIKRLRKKARFVIIPKDVVVSARKYEHNSYLRVNIANLIVFLMFLWGSKPNHLRAIYRRLILHPKDIA